MGAGGPEIDAPGGDARRSRTACASSRSRRARAPSACRRAADALLLITGRAPESLSSKLPEYLASGRPVFAVTSTQSAAHALVTEAGGGRCVVARRTPGARRSRPSSPTRARAACRPPTATVVRRFDGRELTGLLAALLDDLTADRG